MLPLPESNLVQTWVAGGWTSHCPYPACVTGSLRFMSLTLKLGDFNASNWGRQKKGSASSHMSIKWVPKFLKCNSTVSSSAGLPNLHLWTLPQPFLLSSPGTWHKTHRCGLDQKSDQHQKESRSPRSHERPAKKKMRRKKFPWTRALVEKKMKEKNLPCLSERLAVSEWPEAAVRL